MTENIHALKARKAELIEQINLIEIDIISVKAEVEKFKASTIAAPAWMTRKRCAMNAEKNTLQLELSRVNNQIKAVNIKTNVEDYNRRLSRAGRAEAAEMRKYRIFFEVAKEKLSEGSFKTIHAAAIERAVVEVRG